MRAAGERLGPYEILQLIGKGGMGEVYRARDTRLGREVALKTLATERESDAAALARLRSEAQAVAALNHPHIVSVLDVGEEQGVSFVVMELVEGRTLREELDEGALPVRRALDRAQQVAEALAAAHARGIVHRDLKPENIIVTRDGQVKILDFGLAKLNLPLAGGVDDSTLGGLPRPVTQPGIVMGTVGYMSPEQVRGAPVDHRSDQFAFGAILYEMLGGRRAFARATAADTLAAILREPAEPLETLAGAESAPLRWLVERCLAKEPQERYDSTRDLALELARIRTTLAMPVVARTASRSRSGAPSRRLWAAVLVTVGLLLAAGVYWGRRQAPPAFDQITFGRGTAWAGRYAADGETVVYAAAWSGGPFRIYRKEPHNPQSLELPLAPPVSILAVSATHDMAVATGLRGVLPGRLCGTLSLSATTGGAAREILEGVPGADFGPSDELAVVHCRAGRCVLEYPLGTQIYASDGWMTGPRVSPGGQEVAVIDHPMPLDDLGSILVVDRAGRTRQVGGLWASTNGLAWAPGGGEIWLAGSEHTGLRALHGVRLSGETRLLARIPASLSLLDVSPKGEALVACDARRIGLMAYRPGWRAAREMTVFDSSVLAGLSDDGAMILSTEIGQSGGSRYSVYLRRDPESPPVRLGEGLALALSPDGRFALALVPSVPPELIAYPTGTGRPIKIVQVTRGVCRAASFFPDGRRLVVALSEPGRGTRLHLQEFPSGASRPLGAEAVLVCNLQGFPVSPDGKWIAAVGVDERLALYSVDDGSSRPLARLPAGLAPIRWLADGRSLLVYRLDEFPARVRRVRIPDGSPEPLLEIRVSDPDGIQGFPAIRFTPDGRSYAYSYARFLSDLYTVKGID